MQTARVGQCLHPSDGARNGSLRRPGLGGGWHTQAARLKLKTGVAVYGGFAGTESLLSERDIVANPIILSGDIGAYEIEVDFTIFLPIIIKPEPISAKKELKQPARYRDRDAGPCISSGSVGCLTG